ncbi:hypothetical protein ACFFHM_00795 [Halalkalibacter kiskunsagensis]|uniref:Uncharacterized protein n=1 Tax=Halalkalibacter kiskunsagensis TaxID=1548599 RepID=A0ABV6KBB9_9BACI
MSRANVMPKLIGSTLPKIRRTLGMLLPKINLQVEQSPIFGRLPKE